ncbi:MAG: hypothetical protein WCH01_01100 [Methylococcaceae bacterium]
MAKQKGAEAPYELDNEERSTTSLAVRLGSPNIYKTIRFLESTGGSRRPLNTHSKPLELFKPNLQRTLKMNKLIATLIVGAFSAAAFAATPAPAATDAKPAEATAPVKKAAHKKVKIAHAKKAKAEGVTAASVNPAIK